MKRLAQSLFIITILALATLRLSSAFFSDTETSSENVLAAGTIDLLVNGADNPEAIVNFTDLKPGDDHIVPKILRVNDNNAWVWMHLVSYVSAQGTQTEPEEEEENGVPKHDIENYINYDLGFEGQDPIISLADEVPFTEAFSCWIPLGELSGAEDYTLNQSFHFDESVTNWAQGDSLSFIEEFYAVQSRNNPNPQPPVSESGRVWNPETRRCEDGQCEPLEVYADSPVSNSQGLRKNGSAVLESRSTPSTATGAPDGNGNTNTGFYSLGYGGSITVKFANPVGDGDGPDISIHEVTNGRTTYPLEKALIEVSANGTTWYSIGEATSQSPSGITLLDINTNPTAPAQVLYVRVTDTSNSALNSDPLSDGFDLDAVDGVYGNCSLN